MCVGGSPRRMQNLAHFLTEALDYKVPTGMNLVNIARGKGRYAMYKVGPVLTVSVSIITVEQLYCLVLYTVNPLSIAGTIL